MLKTQGKKNQIISAAENLFHHYGYAKTSLEDIAREVALGKATIYYYFDSKEDIFFEVLKKHSRQFYLLLYEELAKQPDFKSRFTTAIKLPIKLVYEHAPILFEAIKSIPENSLQKLCAFRDENRLKMTEVLRDVIDFGLQRSEITSEIPVEKMVNIIFDWFLLGDSNIIVRYPEEFIKKAETDYNWIVQILLNGLLKRG